MLPPTSPASFPLFSSFPTELRQTIFLHAATTPRIVPLTYDPTTFTFHSPTPPPALLSASHSSRLAALNSYTLSFGTTSSPAKTYFNPHFDTLYLPRHLEMGYDSTLHDFRSLVNDPSSILSEVQSVAIDYVREDIKRPWESYNKASFIRSFANLKEVILVLNDDGDDELGVNEEVDFVESKWNPERSLQVWFYFRQRFLQEERVLEEVCKESEREYVAFQLPIVRIRRKVRKARSETQRASEIMGAEEALESLGL